LALVAGETLTIEETVSISRIRDAMERAGFTAPATALAIHELKKTGLIEVHQGQDWNGNDYLTCQMTNDGFSKLKSLSSKIALVQEAVPKKPQAPRGRGPRESFSADLDDEIPF
jgi:hypothetical protein